MTHHSSWISFLLVCILSLLCFPSLIYAQHVGTVRLREERPIFQDYAVFEPNSKQYVRVICQTGEYPPPAKPTIELVYPLFKAQAGETLLLTSLLPCYDNKNGYFVQVITQQNRVGITQLPNYQHLVETTDAEGAFQVLSLFSDCGGDPECIVNQYAEPYRQFTKRYPDSKRVAKAAEISGRYYKQLTRDFQAIADNPAILRNFHSRYSTYSPETLRAKAKEYSALRAEMNALELKTYGKNKPEQPTVSPPPTAATSKPTQQTVPTPQSAPISLNNSAVRYGILSLIIVLIIAGCVWYALNTPDLITSTILIIASIVIGSTIAAVLLTHSGHQAMGTAFVFLMWWFVPLPWIYLMFNWNNLFINDSWDDSGFHTHIGHVITGIVLPVLIIGYISANFSFHAALCFLFGVNTLLFWYVHLTRIAALRREAAKRKDAEHRKFLIDSIMPYTRPLLQFLTRYHPDTYPPPVNRRMAMAISTYAKRIGMYERANGHVPPSVPDFDLLRFSNPPFSATSFSSSWDSQETGDFCGSFMEMVARLALTADLGLEVNTQYAAELTAVFEAKTDTAQKKAEAQLPPFVHERSKRVEDWLIDRKDVTPEQKIGWIDEQLTALIPDHIAKTQTVIGTPLDGLPVAYESLETRYRHTFLIGRSGAGKSTVITNLVAQDMRKGYGVIVMSPDQDLMRRIVPYIPEHRLDDVIYFDPTDTTPPIIGFNPFFFEPLNNPSEYQLLKTRKAGETFIVLERTLEIDTEPTKRLLNNAMYALIGRPHTTINDLRRLIDPKERAFHAEVANDPRVDTPTREFWATYATESANAMVYRNLIGRIIDLLRPPLFDIFSTQSFSFHRELNERSRILLIDLSNFSRDSREAKITAQLLIATIQQTMLRRDKMQQSDYLPYFMYIDEFQNFADTNERSISAMTEQLRKYFFGLTLTSLVASDLSTRLFDTIIGVMSTFICLSISAKDAGRFASEMSIKRPDRDSFNPEALQKLQVGQAYVLTPPLDAAVFVQIPREPPGNLPTLLTTIDDLKKRSKANFGAIPRPVATPLETTRTTIDQEDESPVSPSPTPKPPPKRTNRRGRKRFEDDEELPLIEVC